MCDAAIGFGVLVVAYVEVAFWLVASHRQAHRMRIELFRAILRQDMAWFDTKEALVFQSKF